jgi:hypothetical protein
MFKVDSQQYKRVESHFYDLGYMRQSNLSRDHREEQHLTATGNIIKKYKIIADKREKSIVQYLNYLEDKTYNCAII